MIPLILKPGPVVWVLGRKGQMYLSPKFSDSVMLRSIGDKFAFRYEVVGVEEVGKQLY